MPSATALIRWCYSPPEYVAGETQIRAALFSMLPFGIGSESPTAELVEEEAGTVEQTDEEQAPIMVVKTPSDCR